MNKGKPIQYEAIYNAKNKVNVGVKCDPNIKLELTHEARKLGLTLSEYVELILTTRSEDNSKKLNDLERKVAFYENSFLRSQYEKRVGTTMDVKTPSGEVKTIQVNRIEDIFTALITTVNTN